MLTVSRNGSLSASGTPPAARCPTPERGWALLLPSHPRPHPRETFADAGDAPRVTTHSKVVTSQRKPLRCEIPRKTQRQSDENGGRMGDSLAPRATHTAAAPSAREDTADVGQHCMTCVS